jgi:hypothetical protein
MNEKQVRAKYTTEFNLEAIRQIKAEQSITCWPACLAFPRSA